MEATGSPPYQEVPMTEEDRQTYIMMEEQLKKLTIFIDKLMLNMKTVPDDVVFADMDDDEIDLALSASAVARNNSNH
jgi:hypothetical protein